MNLYILKLVLVMVMVSDARGYHILCYYPTPTKSHDRLAGAIINPLIQAGHKITWVTPFPKGKPENVTIIDVSHIIPITEALDMANRKITGFELAKSFADNITKATFTDDLQRALIENQYDAVITAWFFSDVEAGFAAVQKVPWIMLSPSPMHRRLEVLMGTVTSLVVPVLGHTYPTPLSFWDRLKTTFIRLLTIYDDWVNYTNEASVYESFFGPVAAARGDTLPPLSEAARNIAVLLVNSHPSFAPAHSLPPNVVEIGGYHIDEHTPPLPKDLQAILDSSPEGAVYFSLGSIVKAASLPEQTRRDLIQVLGSSNRTVLWKFEEQLEDLPKNIHIRAWMPQSSILAHPNTKLFITHCGLLSTLEAVHHGVPLLAVPVFADQPENAAHAVHAGYGVRVTFRPDMKEEFSRGLQEALGNDRYYKKAKYLSRLFRRRPVTSPTLIRHYVELAIETNGAHHLRPSSQFYSWYQTWLLDQLAVVLLGPLLLYLLFRKITSSFIKSDLDVSKLNKKRN